MTDLPLCVDLDGTLVRGDTLVEGMLTLAGSARLGVLLGAMASGRARLKARVAELAPPDPALLPYNEALVDWLSAQRAAGRRLVLATAANAHVAEAIAAHLGLFDEVLASSDSHNLKGPAKAAALVERFGERGFAYAGDARADLAVWARAGAAVLVDVAPSVAAQVTAPIEHRIATRPPLLRTLLRAMRPHQWVKNLLVFVPILTANALDDVASWQGGMLAFVAFCAVASGIYMVNDLLDLAADRAHPVKRRRPFAAGDAPAVAGIVLGISLFVFGATVAAWGEILFVVVTYGIISVAYSVWLKRQPLVDVFALAGLFTIRVFGGGEASGHALSLWLLAFASFLFLSLALIKRVAEILEAAERRQRRRVPGRDYGLEDIGILQAFGVAAAFSATLVLALYVQAEASSGRFAAPGLLWAMVPLVLLWSCRMWLSTARGYMLHDPILYAARDRVTWAITVAVIGLMLAAHWGLPGSD